MGELSLATLGRGVGQRQKGGIVQVGGMAGEGSDDAVQTGSVKGQNGKYPGNKGKKLELNLASNKASSTVAVLSE